MFHWYIISMTRDARLHVEQIGVPNLNLKANLWHLQNHLAFLYNKMKFLRFGKFIKAVLINVQKSYSTQ